ncbi:GGDEF domain-containing protein [Saccharobesus litoralis]|uniref:diguanylate cyclase n=1 Tax=Saccharobesus litoralis TaxID=2172099 RepID=A0A2S0VM36_9ALTE|nr:diguanylate cyclase [Saccharobesus litoralis]AWB65242.1 GGDEF domain-containing protein [Saccharobesus litoralis]
MSEQIELLKKKVLKSQKANKLLERSYKAQFETLTQLISRLSQVCKGIDIELDNKLAQLRALIAQGKDFENVESFIQELLGILSQHSKKVSQDMTSTKSSIVDATKNLQKVKGLPKDLKRELEELIEETTSDTDSILHFIPQIDRLVRLYNKSLELAKLDAIPTGGLLNAFANGNGVKEVETIDVVELQKTISNELLNILSNLAFSGDSSNRIEKIRDDLTKPITPKTLVDCCVEVIRIIVGNITEERQSAQNFLLTLNEALTSVHDAVSNSLSGAKKTTSNKKQLNDKLKHNLELISQDVSAATNLDSLKVKVTERIGDIAEALAQKESIEQEEQTLLLTNLSQMQSKLSELESEAETYKTKLSEQRFKSLQDALTKLPNRAAFDERLDIEFTRWQRYNHNLCLAVIDIDHFKSINDNFGHSAGDRTLQVIAMALRKFLRQTDFIARFGGEEFVVLFPESKLNDIIPKLESIREQIKRIPFKFKDKNLNATISIGATQFKKGDTPLGAFDRADEALYKAKRTGRDKVVTTG